MTDDSRVDALSMHSLRLSLYFDKSYLGAATGFVVQHEGKPFLITNWHVVTGRDSETRAQMSSSAPTPDRVLIAHHASGVIAAGPGVWTQREELLYNEDCSPRWLEHPTRYVKDMEDWDEYNADIVALPLTELDERIQLYPVSIGSGVPDILIYPGLPVSIVGYPYAESSKGWFPIWKSGHVASDIDAPGHQRYYLVDATTRTGMSGSPVVCRPLGHFLHRDGTCGVSDGQASHCLGVYSGRIREGAELAIVWRCEMVLEMLTNPAVGSIS